jgi:hypothetical protein
MPSILLPDPADLVTMPPEQLLALVLQLSVLLAAASARLVANGHHRGDDHDDDGDHLLGIQDAAQRLAVTPDWLRRRPKLPFVVKLSEGVVRYSVSGIARFIAAHRQDAR